MLREVKNVVRDHPAENWQGFSAMNTLPFPQVEMALVILGIPMATAEFMNRRCCRTVDLRQSRKEEKKEKPGPQTAVLAKALWPEGQPRNTTWPGGMRPRFTEWAEGESVRTGCGSAKHHFLKVPNTEQRCRVSPVLQLFISCPHFRKRCLTCLHLLAKLLHLRYKEMAQSSNASGSPWSSWRCSCKLLVSVSFKAGRTFGHAMELELNVSHSVL